MNPKISLRLQTCTGWFKLNDGKLFPGQSPRRFFFESDREILYAHSVGYKKKHRAFCFPETYGPFGYEYRLVQGQPRRMPRAIDARMSPWKKTPGGQASGWTHRTRVQNFRVYLLKTAWTFGLLCRKHVKFCELPKLQFRINFGR